MIKKINGVTMDENIIVDIDDNADKIIIPEYAEGTTYQFPLSGIKCIQVSNLDLLCKFIGSPKTVILNISDKSSQNDDTPLAAERLESNKIFERPGLEQIIITGNHNYYKTEDGILYSKDGKTLIKCPIGRTGDVIIPAGTEIIKDFAFKECKISSVVFPDSLKRIGKKAFCSCRQLSCIDFGNGIKEIGSSTPSYTFQSCKSLKEVFFPSQIRTIGNSVFWNCGLKKVHLNDGLVKICDGAFLHCPEIKEINIPDSLKYIGRNNFVDVSEFYLSQVPNGFIQSITSALFTLNESSKKVNTIALHIDVDNKPVYIPKIVRPFDKPVYIPKTVKSVDEASKKIQDAINNHQIDDYANMFQLSIWPACMQDTALYTYLYSYSNDNVENFLKRNCSEIAYRLLNFGRTKDLIDFIKTGLITNKVLDMLSSILQGALICNDISMTDNDKTIIMAYIMEAKEKIRNQKEETLNKFSLPD